MHVHGLWWMEWKLLLYDLSPYINSFESMAISFFFMDLHVPTFFFFLFFSQYLDLHVSIFFFDSRCLSFFFFNKNWRERPTHIVEHLFCGMSGWYNSNYPKKHSKGYMVHVNLDHESMTKVSLEGHNNLTKLNGKRSSICVYSF